MKFPLIKSVCVSADFFGEYQSDEEGKHMCLAFNDISHFRVFLWRCINKILNYVTKMISHSCIQQSLFSKGWKKGGNWAYTRRGEEIHVAKAKYGFYFLCCWLSSGGNVCGNFRMWLENKPGMFERNTNKIMTWFKCHLDQRWTKDLRIHLSHHHANMAVSLVDEASGLDSMEVNVFLMFANHHLFKIVSSALWTINQIHNYFSHWVWFWFHVIRQSIIFLTVDASFAST